MNLLLNMMTFLSFRLMQNSRYFMSFSLGWRLEMIRVFHLKFRVTFLCQRQAKGAPKVQEEKSDEDRGIFFPGWFFLGEV